MYSVVRTCLIIICTCLYLDVSSQHQLKADSILNLIENKELDPDEQLDAYYWLSAYSSSPEDELKYAQLLFELADEINNQEYLVKSNQRIGVAHRLMGNLGVALSYLFESANVATSNDDLAPLLADIYAEISTCYTQNGDSENALTYGLKTIEILRKTDRVQELALNLLNMGYDYYLIGNYDSAIAYYDESEPILTEIGMTIGQAYIIGNKALVFWKTGNTAEAKEGLKTAIAMLETIGDKYGMADYYNQLGTIFLEENNTKQAIINATKSLEMAQEEGYKEQVRDASHLLYLLYLKSNEYKRAIGYQTQYYAYKDSIQNLETTQQLANLRTGFEVGQKQAEVDLLLEQKRSNQIIMITGAIALTIVMILVILIYYYSRSKTKLNMQLQEQKNKLVALNSTKDKFFSIISHDLRGPVNMMSGLVNISKHVLKDAEAKNVELDEMMDKMEISVNRLVKLLDNLLQWALQQQGHFPYAPEKISLKEMLTDSVDMFMDMATSKKIKLDLNFENDFNVFVDSNTTSTIFRNLLNNSIKFTPEGGEVQVIAEKNGKPNYGTIKVVDNGVGIPDDKLKILFGLNENITTKGTSGESGLGLGLQLVHEFVQLNKGEIEVESEDGEGSTFIVHLPLDE